MTNEQILRKAIEKAIKNGWNPIDDMGEVHNFEIYRKNGHWKGMWIGFSTEVGDGGQLDLTSMIFDHSFAKAFWGEEKVSDGKGFDIGKRWQYYLQAMVIEPEPLKYLSKFLGVSNV